MKLKGNVNINAPRDKVWKFLTDPYAVGRCAPGLERMEVITPNKKFRVVASVRLGTVKATFNSEVEWEDLADSVGGKFVAHGTAPGSSVDATSEMRLLDGKNGTTEMEWNADIVVRGKIATVASRLMGGVTQKLATEFFECVKKRLESAPDIMPEDKTENKE